MIRGRQRPCGAPEQRARRRAPPFSLPARRRGRNLRAVSSTSRAASMSTKKVRVAIVGLGFGAEFIPIYQAHPNAEMYAVCRRDKAELDRCQKQFGIPKAYSSYEELLKDPNVDAVHINSPIPDHGPQTIAALKAG